MKFQIIRLRQKLGSTAMRWEQETLPTVYAELDEARLALDTLPHGDIVWVYSYVIVAVR